MLDFEDNLKDNEKKKINMLFKNANTTPQSCSQSASRLGTKCNWRSKGAQMLWLGISYFQNLSVFGKMLTDSINKVNHVNKKLKIGK